MQLQGLLSMAAIGLATPTTQDQPGERNLTTGLQSVEKSAGLTWRLPGLKNVCLCVVAWRDIWWSALAEFLLCCYFTSLHKEL